jgi:hypothetical protein
LIQEDARKRIQALFENANKPSDDSYTPLPTADEEIKALRSEIKAEMSSGWFGGWMMSFKEGADIYLESVFAIIVPFLLAAAGAGHVFHTLRVEGRHEEAAAGKIRTPAMPGAYHQQATGALSNWSAEKPEVGQATRRFSPADVPSGAPRR